MSTNQQDFRNFEIPYQNTGFDAELAQNPRSRRNGSCCFFGCCLGCLGFLILIALACFAFGYCLMSGGADLIVSEETTVITEPLKSDGKTVDFFKAIQEMTEPQIPADENGFRDVLLAFGQGIFGDGRNAEQRYIATCEALGVDPQTPPKKIAFNDKNLDSVQAAVAKPHYFIPLVRQSEKDLMVASLPNYNSVFSFYGNLFEALLKRSKNRFDGGENVTAAWKDTLASLRLFRFVAANGLGVSERDSKQHKLLALHDSEVVKTLPKWTSEQLHQAIKDLESLPNWQDWQRTLTMIQYYLLDLLSATNDWENLVDVLGNGMPPNERQVWAGMFQLIAFDWNLVAKELNREIKAYGELLEKAEGGNRDEQFDLLDLRPMDVAVEMNEEELTALLEDAIRTTGDFPLFTSGRSKLAGFIAGNLVKKVMGELFRLQLMEESRCQALRLAMALELYHREHQNYPDSLDELGLQPMPENMSFQYQKQEAGYRLQNRVFELER